jgi:trans-aconitate methyltransferase
MPEIPLRFEWALNVLPVRPADRILEIGCGRGGIIRFIVPRLTTGTILGIDRSDKMIEAATVNNRPAIEAGTLTLRKGDIEDADLGAAKYDTIFAVNVSLFSRDCDAVLARLKRQLKPKGGLFLFYESPSTDHVAAFADRARASLEAAGFAVETGPGDGVGSCLIARRA